MKFLIRVLGYFVLCAFIGFFGMWAFHTVSDQFRDGRTTEISVVPSPGSTAYAAPTTQPSAVPVESPRPYMDILEELPVDVRYGHLADNAVNTYDGCARIQARVPAQSWSLPYPYHLTIPAMNVDCGFFPALHEGTWRVAYCLNVTKTAREAKKLFLYKDEEYKEKNDAIALVIGKDDFGSFIKGTCP